MSQLWVQGESGSADWGVMPLTGVPVVLAGAVRSLAESSDGQGKNSAAPILTRQAAAGGSEHWVLTARAGQHVRVNGLPLTAGIRVLRDKDEIRQPGANPMFFSTERLPVVEPFPGAEQPVLCPRCRQEVKPGDPAVRCPGSGCGLWFHQRDDLPCWTGYPTEPFKTCAMCDYPAALYPDADFRWTPEGL